ncbi:PREDICTED: eukaryotic [Prunus dulcis]|uniref:Serine-threonine kinase receptor-associated protein n=1 Tax=Prunus dulcis TaxID=3755 RepID=A0A5E4EUL8_PRUDU|nr:PREDICTED: eukaryotic [Prunus dulcis]
MMPILMKGHERPLTFLTYDRERDLLLSCGKDHRVCGSPTMASASAPIAATTVPFGVVISQETPRASSPAARIRPPSCGTFRPVSSYSPLILTPARSVDLSVGDRLAVITTDPFMELSSAIHVKRIAKDPADQVGESALILKGPQGRIQRAVWWPLNRTIISAGEDAVIRIWDSETGKLLKENDKEVGHKKAITSLAKSVDGSHFLTGSLDKSAKLWDIRMLTLIKTYVTERPVNAVALSPLLDHVVLGGGQDASAVTTTDHRAGKFEAKFYDRVLQEEIGGAKGHFGPIIGFVAFMNT